MSRLRSRWLKAVAGATLAGISGAAVVLERRRARRRSRATREAQTAQALEGSALIEAGEQPNPPAYRAEEEPGQQQGPPPPPSKTWFAAQYFGLLALLTLMAGTGLAIRGIRRYPPETHFHVHGGDPQRGRAAMERHGCGGCHIIPGIRGATGRVGPSLDGFAERMYIGGQLPNTPEHLIAWLQNPQRYAPGTAMPKLPVTEAEARDMAAFIYDD